MQARDHGDLRRRILEEMTVDCSTMLERGFDLAKQFVRLDADGRVDVLYREGVSGKDRILLYLIGKRYAHEANLAPTYDVANAELLEQLAMPEGSLHPWLKDLRESGRIVQAKRGRRVYHSIPASLVGAALERIERQLTERHGASTSSPGHP